MSSENKVILYTEKPSGHFYWLDLIRFMAAFIVIIGHYRQALFPEFIDLPISERGILSAMFYASTRMGYEAVVVFFILSGFLVGGKAIERIVAKSFAPRKYAVDRFVRIMLPLISALVLYLPICLLIGKPIVAWDWIGTLLSIQGIFCEPPIDVLWSLNFEVWFYILMFGFGYLIMRRDNRKSLIGITVLTIVFMVFTRLFTVYLFIWFIGAAGYLLHPKTSRILCWGFGIASLAFLGLLQFTQSSNVLNLFHFTPTGRYCILILMSFCFSCFLSQIIRIVPTHKWSKRINSIGTFMASFSYTLYLTHRPILELIQYLGFKQADCISWISIGIYCISIICGLVGAYIMYLLFEKNTGYVKRIINTKIDALYLKYQRSFMGGVTR